MPRTLLLTGIGGFIGSHVMEHVLATMDWHVVGIDSFRHKGLTERITDSEHYQDNFPRVRVFTHDLLAPLSPLLIEEIGPVDFVINMAAESHVDRSIAAPVPFVTNNVAVTLNMLEYARVAKPAAFIQISTDEVYGPMVGDRGHAEWAPILPSNPYAASKAAQEAIAIAYWRTYKVPLIITNTMNNFGERQDPEKFLPLVIRQVLAGEEVTIHGTPADIGSRYWLHARNHADALLYLLDAGRPAAARFPLAQQPDRWNIVGERRIDNLDLARQVAAVLEKPLRFRLEDFHTTRPGHDPHYGLDGSKLARAGWAPPVDFAAALRRTIDWYVANPRWLTL